MRVLVACEESQAVCEAFRKRGHEAYSCDLEECSGSHPEWHIQQDVIPLINGNCVFTTCKCMFGGGDTIEINGKWDLIIAHPPCTYLTVTGNRWFDEKQFGRLARERKVEQDDAIDFFMQFVKADCERIAIENPIGVMSTAYRKPDQVIQPYMFGHPNRKATCLWLKNLPLLKATKVVEPDVYYYLAKNGKIKSDSKWRGQCKAEERAKVRSKTFKGIAEAMAEQWG